MISASMAVPEIVSSWDDLLQDVPNAEAWKQKRGLLRQRFLDLIRDEAKPASVDLDLRVEETVEVDGIYERILLSYQVEPEERAFAYLGLPFERESRSPAVLALHGTTAEGGLQTIGLAGNPDKAYLDQLCRRGFIALAPEHFVSGRRTPSEGPYETAAFYKKHPEWTAVGKFTYEHSRALDVLVERPDVDAGRIGVMGHSLGGHGAYYLAAYDERVRATVCNCGGAFFRHNPQVESQARDHWYVYFKHLRADLLQGKLPPIDIHEIIALIAPRAFLDLSGWNDGYVPTQKQRVLLMLKLADLYSLLGQPERFAFYVHGRGHSVAWESRELIYGFLRSHLAPLEEPA